MKFERVPMLFLSEVFDAVAVVVACLSSLLKLSTEPSGKSVSLHRIYKPTLRAEATFSQYELVCEK